MEPRSSRSLSSPDSESSFVEETCKRHKVHSSSEDNSDGSTASSLKKKLKSLPSTSEGSSFCDRSAVISNRIFRKKDFLCHLQELSNSIEEQDEAEVNSANKMSSMTHSKLPNSRARRRAKFHEIEPNISRELNIKTKIPRLENQEEFFENSSRYKDSSGERLASTESGKSSSRSNLTRSEEQKCGFYRNEKKSRAYKSSALSPSPTRNFPGNFSNLNSQQTKRVGGYRPTSIFVRNLSSESDSDSGTDKLYPNLRHFKAKNDVIHVESRAALRKIQKSSLDSSSSSRKFCDKEIPLRNIFNHVESSTGLNKAETENVDDFEEFVQNLMIKDPLSTFSTPRKKTNQDCNRTFYSAPISSRSDSHEIDGQNSQKFVRSQNIERDSSSVNYYPIRRLESNPKTKDTSLKNEIKVPDLKIRSPNSSVSTSSKIEDHQFLDMKDLVSVLSEVSFKRENAFGDSGHSQEDFSMGCLEKTPKFEAKSVEESNFKNLQETSKNVSTSRSECLQIRNSQNVKTIESVFLDFEASKDKLCYWADKIEKKSCLNSKVEIHANKIPPSEESKLIVNQGNLQSDSKVVENCSNEFINNSSTVIKSPGEKISSRENEKTKLPSRRETEAVLDYSLMQMFESCVGDSNQQDQRKWAFRREIGGKRPCETAERYHQEQKQKLDSAINLFERSAYFNAKKLAKSESTATFPQKSPEHLNLTTKNSSSMSKLSCLLDSMKKEKQDRFSFTISENNCQNSSKFRTEDNQIQVQKTLSSLKNKSEENIYNLDTHPSITRLALSGTELLPSELIDSISFKDTTKIQNFLPRMKNYVRRLSTRLTRKNSLKNSKPNSPKVLFTNSKCHYDESVESSGDTMELHFINKKSKLSTKNASDSQEIKQRNSTSSEESDKHDSHQFSIQRFNSETDSCQLSEVKSSRTKSSPVDIISRRNRFLTTDEIETNNIENFLLDKRGKEMSKLSSPKPEETSVDALRLESQEPPKENAVDINCFCFKMCRSFVQPSVASPEKIYLSSSKMSNFKGET